MMDAKYINIVISMRESVNAFQITGRVSKALKDNGVPQEEIEAYKKESFSGDYDHLITTAEKMITINWGV